jgi:TPR repeat protein
MRLKSLMLGCLITLTSAGYAQTPTLKMGVEAFGDKDYDQALRIFQRLSDEGNPIAQFRMAKIHRFGLGREPDFAKALKWYQKAAQQNYAVAMSHLGEMYEQGLGAEVNMDTARNWYRMACSNRCSEGCKHLKRLDAL